MQLTLRDISNVLNAAPPAAADAIVRGYSIDSRTVRPGELFFAIRGENLDGHTFVLRALQAGAAAAVVQTSRIAEFPDSVRAQLLAVPNTLAALQQLAAEVRRQWAGPVVAITGSAGKTTTRQVISALLATRFRVLQSEKNFNNHIGLPLSLLRLDADIDVGVFELGMSAPGEIRLLAGLAAPDVGVVTNVSGVHLEFFPGVDAIARAKYELIEMLGGDAWAVLNADDVRVRGFGDNMRERALYFGFSEAAHFRADDMQQLPDGTSFVLRTNAPPKIISGPAGKLRDSSMHTATSASTGVEAVRFHMPLLGRHNVLNVLAGIAVCYTFGIPRHL